MSTAPAKIPGSALSDSTASTLLDDVIEWALVLMLAFMPLAYGAIDAWSEFPALIAVAAMSLVLGFKLLINPQRPFRWSWAYVPMVAFWLLALLQLVPLGEGFIKAISPWTWKMRALLLNDLVHARPDLLHRMTLSMYPYATSHQLTFVAALGVVFVVTLNVFTTPQAVRRLLIAITLIGALEGGIALTQDLLHAKAVYGITANPVGESLATAGSFFNHSHFSQFMNLSMGAAIGLLLLLLTEPRPVTARTLRRDWPRWLAILGLVAMLLLGMITLFYARSRGGIIACCAAGGATAVIFFIRRGLKRPASRGAIAVYFLLAASIAAAVIGWKTFSTQVAYEQAIGRKQMAIDALKAYRSAPILGTGLGTHAVVFPMFDTSTIGNRSDYVENEYIQVAEEMGTAGLLCLAAFVLVLLGNYIRAVRRDDAPITVVAFGLGFGLLAVMIHSLSDFGQHIPAIAALSAVSCGLIFSLAHLRGNTFRSENLRSAVAAAHAVKKPVQREEEADYPTWNPRPNAIDWPTRRRVALRLLTIFALVAAIVFAWRGGWRASRAEAYYNALLTVRADIRQGQAQSEVDPDKLAALRNYAISASIMQPYNVHYSYLRAEAMWLTIQNMDGTGKPLRSFTEKQRAACRVLVAYLDNCRTLCPSYGPVLMLQGTVEYFGLGIEDVGARLMQLATITASYDADVQFRAGEMEAATGHDDLAVAHLRRAEEMEFGKYADIIDAVANRLHRPDLAARALEVNPTATALLSAWCGIDGQGPAAKIMATLPEDQKVQFAQHLAEAQPIMDQALTQFCDRPDASNTLLVSFGEKLLGQQKYPQALAYLQRALTREDNYNLRMEVAVCLAYTGQREQALKEVQRCLQQKPNDAAAQKLRDMLLNSQ